MAQWTYRASSANTAGASSGGALGISPGVTPASGNLAVVVALWEPDTNTVTPPAGFTELHAGGQANTGLFTIRAYGKITTGSESLPYTFTPGVGGNWRGLVIALYENGTGALTVDVSGASQGDSQSEANQTAPSVTTTGTNRLIIRAGGNSAANPSSMVGAATNLRGVSGGASLADGAKAAAGATGVTEAHGAGTDDYAGIHIAIISDSGGGAGAVLAGSSAGTSTAGANLSTAKPLAGASAGTSTAGANLSVSPSGGAAAVLAGASAGTSTAGATLRIQHALVGSSAGTSTAGANLLTAKPLTGASAGTSTAGANLSTVKPLAGSTAGTSTAGATLRMVHPLVGSTAGTSTAGGTVDIPLPIVSDRLATPVHMALGGRGSDHDDERTPSHTDNWRGACYSYV